MIINRIIIIALFILSLVGISFYGGPISYGFFWFVIGVIITCLLHCLYQFLMYRIYQKIESRDLIVDKPTPFFYNIANESPFAFSGVGVSFFYDYSKIIGLDKKIIYQLNPRTNIKIETEIVCKYRGEYEVGIQEIEIVDFLKVFKFRFRNKETLKIFVHPQIVTLENLKSADNERISVLERQLGSNHRDVLVREYMPGDDIRYLNWKASAKSQSLMVSKLNDDEEKYITIVCDAIRYSDYRNEYLPLENKILETVIALARFYVGKNIPVKNCLYIEGLRTISVPTLSRFNDLYSVLCSYNFNTTNCMSYFASQLVTDGEIFSGHMAIFVLHSLDEKICDLFEKLNAQRIPVMCYIVSDENIVFPDINNTIFYRIPIESDLREVL